MLYMSVPTRCTPRTYTMLYVNYISRELEEKRKLPNTTAQTIGTSSDGTQRFPVHRRTHGLGGLNFIHSGELFKKKNTYALADVAQRIKCGLRTKGLLVQIPARAHAWVAGQVPQQGAHDRQPHIDVSLPLFLPPSLSLK